MHAPQPKLVYIYVPPGVHVPPGVGAPSAGGSTEPDLRQANAPTTGRRDHHGMTTFATSSSAMNPGSSHARVEGFHVPSSAASVSSPGKVTGFDGPRTTQGFPDTSSGGGGYIDPSMLLHFEPGSPSGGGMRGSGMFPASGSTHPHLQAHSGGGRISDLDLDFEATLASLGYDGQQASNQADYGYAGANGFANSGHGQALGTWGMQHVPTTATTMASSLPAYLALSQVQQQPTKPGHSFYTSPSPRDDPSPGSAYNGRRGSTSNQDSPGDLQPGQGQQFGSLSSVSEVVSPPSGGETSTGSRQRRSSPSVERSSRSSAVGKAPNSSHRSRSARRSASSITSAHGRPQSPMARHGSASIVIPSSSSAAMSNPSIAQQSHALAMSMPAFPTSHAGGGPGSSATSWYNSAHSMAFAGQSQGTDVSDSVTGWKPSGGAVANSAPVPRVSTSLEDVPEDGSYKGNSSALNEKRRKRRESHNAVERRRRDNINDRISELAALLPAYMIDAGMNDENAMPEPGTPVMPTTLFSPTGAPSSLPTISGSPPDGRSGSRTLDKKPTAGAGGPGGNNAGKPNKGVVLAKSVEYIRYLQQLVELQSQRGAELERMVVQLRGTSLGDSSNGQPSNGSAMGGREQSSYQQYQQHTGQQDDSRSSTDDFSPQGGLSSPSVTGMEDANSPMRFPDPAQYANWPTFKMEDRDDDEMLG